MKLNLSALAVRERAITLFFMILLAVAGAYAFVQLGRAEDPAFTIKSLTVSAAWPGADAQEMQDLVAEPLEKRLQELEWYDRVETTARAGLVLMTLTLRDDTPPEEVDEQFYQARKKLFDETPNLPSGVQGPMVNDEFSDVTFALYALKAPDLPMRELVRQAELVRQEMLTVPGVEKVNILGEQAEQIFVEFSYEKLATLGLSVPDISLALQRQNDVTPAGSVDTSGPQVVLRFDGEYTDLDTIAATPLTVGGRTLVLSDIATIRRGYEDPPSFLIRTNGEPVLMIDIVMTQGWNGLDLGKALLERSDAISAKLPLGMTFDKISDQAVNIDAAVSEFMLKFAMALAVVLFVSLVSLGWRVGIVVALAVPLTLAFVFLIMLETGRFFDRITLGALILALGLLVDDAIIAIEVMVVRMEEGMDRMKAAAYAWSHTAAPMLSGTLVTIIGLMPVGFAQSSAGEYAGNIFWVVGFALIASWLVAVIFTPYLGVKLLPEIKTVEGGHAAIYDTPNYRRLRGLIKLSIRHKFTVCAIVAMVMAFSVVGMGGVTQQFFPSSDRPEVLVEVRMPEGASIGTTAAAVEKIERWLDDQPEAEIVSSYVGQGAPRFFFAMAPELPDPAFAKMIVMTPDAEDRETLKHRLRAAIADGLASEADVRVTQLVFGPYTPFPVEFRIMGPDPVKLHDLSSRALDILRTVPEVRQPTRDWGDRVPVQRFIPDPQRLDLIGLSPGEAAQQLLFLSEGIPLTYVREDIRNVPIIGRSAGEARLDPSNLTAFTLISRSGEKIPLDQVGRIEIGFEDPILKRRDRTPVITVRADIDEERQPPEVSLAVQEALQPLIEDLPLGYRIEMGGNIEESQKASTALVKVFPVMIATMLIVIILQVRSIPTMIMVLMTAPLGLAGAAPVLLLFNQPFGFNAILGLIGLAGILMRNTLILTQQIKDNQDAGLNDYDAVVEATVQRTRPVLLTAIAAVLAFVPLTHSVFWGSMAYTLIGGTAVGTVLILLFLPALYATWFRINPPEKEQDRNNFETKTSHSQS